MGQQRRQGYLLIFAYRDFVIDFLIGLMPIVPLKIGHVF